MTVCGQHRFAACRKHRYNLRTQNEVACGKRCYAVGINDVLLGRNDVTAYAVTVLRFAQIYGIIPVDEVIL